MKESIEFSALVHSATAYLDFRSRLLARPAWFTDADAAAIMDLMRSAKVRSSLLPDRERWLHVSDGRMVVFGVVAMSTFFSSDMTHELVLQGGQEVPRRENDAFVGFAAPAELLIGRSITPARDPALYRAVYAELIGPRWRERQSSPGRERPTLSTPQRLDVEAVPLAAVSETPRRVVVFPHAQADEAWREGTSRRLDVILGLPSAKDAARSSHADIATVDDVDARTEIERETRQAPDTPPAEPAGLPAPPGRRARARASAAASAKADASENTSKRTLQEDEPCASPKRPVDAFFALAAVGIALVALLIAATRS